MKKRSVIALAGLAMLCTVGCSSQQESLGVSSWKLTQLDGKENTAFAEGDHFTLSIAADSTVNGVGACNRFFGSYTLKKKNEIDIQMGGSTMMACPNMELEQPFFQMLDGADRYSIEKETLRLYKQDKEVALFTAYTPVVDMHTAENSLDYCGTYTGTLPAADCPGIETTITINNDNTFSMHMKYLERDSEFTENGTYTIEGNKLTFKSGDQTSYFQVGENKITWLDGDGNVITGDLASFYVLKKKVD